jgi:Peptidase A4 family/IPT/TIG domain
MSWRLVRVLAALVTICSVGIVLSGTAATATGPLTIGSVSPISPGAAITHANSADAPAPFGPSPVHWQGGQQPHIVGHALGGGTQDSIASTNWSGYIASGTTFTGVGGDWTVPSVAASAAPEYSSAWIGIDGVFNSDLIQTGTSQDTPSTGTPFFAWYELLPGSAIEIGEPVDPGDAMAAEIVQVSPGNWTISIDDQTQGWMYTHTFAYSIPAQSAEWIQEAPTVNGAQSTLADFGPTTFSSLGLNGTNTAAVGLTDVDLTNASGTIIAYPTALTTSGFTIYYGTPRPSVTSISPASGSTAGGTAVAIQGNYLYGVTAVTFGGVPASGYLNADGSISVNAPPEGPGTVPVLVYTAGGSSQSVPADAFTYVTPTPPVTSSGTPTSTHGYWLDGSDGGIFTFGSAQFYGSTGSLKLQRPVVGIVPTADKGGYWLDASDGGIFAFGDSGFYGSIPGLGLHPAGSGEPNSLDAPIVGMVPSADGGGYFMVASDGGVFAFGDARFAGSCPGIGGCSGAALAVMPDASGNGYWLVTQTGHVYTFGDAQNFGAPGPQSVPVTSAVRTPDGNGYWILFANGTIDNYGDAGNFGSPAGQFGGLNPATAIFTTSDGQGYWVASANGSVDNYGDAPVEGSMAGTHLNGSIIAATGW